MLIRHALLLGLLAGGGSVLVVWLVWRMPIEKCIVALLLQERIAGKFPAYEGILLVKEPK